MEQHCIMKTIRDCNSVSPPDIVEVIQAVLKDFRHGQSTNSSNPFPYEGLIASAPIAVVALGIVPNGDDECLSWLPSETDASDLALGRLDIDCEQSGPFDLTEGVDDVVDGLGNVDGTIWSFDHLSGRMALGLRQVCDYDGAHVRGTAQQIGWMEGG